MAAATCGVAARSSGAARRRPSAARAVQDGSSPTTGAPAPTCGRSGVQRGDAPAPGAVQLAGGDPGQAAADRLGRAAHPYPACSSTATAAPADLGREGVGERVDPQHHVAVPARGRRGRRPGLANQRVEGLRRRRSAGRVARSTPAGQVPAGAAPSRIAPVHSAGSRARGEPAAPSGAASRARSASAAAAAGGSAVQDLRLVRGHVDAGRAVRRAALAGQAEVQRLVHLRRAPAAGDERPGDHLLQHPGPAAGGVLLVPGGQVGRAHHPAGRRSCRPGTCPPRRSGAPRGDRSPRSCR